VGVVACWVHLGRQVQDVEVAQDEGGGLDLAGKPVPLKRMAAEQVSPGTKETNVTAFRERGLEKVRMGGLVRG